jgi:DNA-binding CsgD family transcriptional regulator
MRFDDIAALVPLLSEQPSRRAYRETVRQQLLRLIPADDALWLQAADEHGSATAALRGDPFTADRELAHDLARLWTQHPTPRWQTAHPYDRTPFRVSDVLAPRRWRQNPVFHELRSAMPEHQLMIAPPPPARYRAWVLVREGRDFSDAEAGVAAAVAPVLASFGFMYDRLEPWQELTRTSSNTSTALTARELSVLASLADGCAAGAIGRRLGISNRTVGKHLEHIYRKLGCSDRLVAVTLGYQLGLLPPKALTDSDAGLAASADKVTNENGDRRPK